MESEDAPRLGMLVRSMNAIPFFPRDAQARKPVLEWLAATFQTIDEAESFVKIAIEVSDKYHGIPGLRRIAVIHMDTRRAVDNYEIRSIPNAKPDCPKCQGRGVLTRINEAVSGLTEVECECVHEAFESTPEKQGPKCVFCSDTGMAGIGRNRSPCGACSVGRKLRRSA